MRRMHFINPASPKAEVGVRVGSGSGLGLRLGLRAESSVGLPRTTRKSITKAQCMDVKLLCMEGKLLDGKWMVNDCVWMVKALDKATADYTGTMQSQIRYNHKYDAVTITVKSQSHGTRLELDRLQFIVY